ncbi:MAG TPA: uroporphyrinogen-III C-methyltransferase [Pirellulaceae bacterium]|jgi:uroporphyrinogen III methyltransferase/synthase|nr:uroporphyrinogen-III C-methyltransferase [Pirellulaceae bacterium]
MQRFGKVYLVGAGPGDPGMLTLRAVEALRRAEVVLYDYLANPAALNFVSPEAETICLGKHGRERIWSQAEIEAAMVEHARRGRIVVRLKGGDPAVFARGAQEMEALRQAGIPWETVPGVTSALAAGSYAGIPVTHSDLASAVALVAGREANDKAETAVDFAALAKFPGTIVIYMGVTTARAWSAALLAGGKDPATPVALVRKCSLPEQSVHRCTLAEVAERLEGPNKLRPPILAIVGDVAKLGERYDWFSQRPMFGRTVLVARPAAQAAALAAPLAELGAETILAPAIQIRSLASSPAVQEVIRRLNQFKGVAFSSRNGAEAFAEALTLAGKDARALGATKLAAIGPGTAAALREQRLVPDLVAAEPYRAETLAETLLSLPGTGPILLVRASRGRETLGETLTASGRSVEQVVFYESEDVEAADEATIERMRSGEIDYVVATSSMIARSLVRLYGEALKRTKLVSISALTSQTLGELSYPAAVEARAATMRGIACALLHDAGVDPEAALAGILHEFDDDDET